MFKNCKGGGNPRKFPCLCAIALGGIIFLSMFCSVEFLLFLAAIALIGLGVAMLFFFK